MLWGTSAIPTDLLAVNLPTLVLSLFIVRGAPTLYPPAVCATFAQATVDAVLSHPVANFEADADFLAQCAAMTVGTFGDFVGPDFAAR